jgi:acetolactate synthase-1/2/3 large subunit
VTGADLVCSTLEQLGIRCVFGMPGTQSLPLYNALRTSKLRTITATHELAAAFMANGYFRASGKPAALLTIPGPGLTYALTGLAEAQHDSAAVLYLMARRMASKDRPFAFQQIDQKSILSSVVKKSFSISSAGDIVTALTEALTTATSGQPGPVVVELDTDMLFSPAEVSAPAPMTGVASISVSDKDVSGICDRFRHSKRPVLFLGQGAQEGSAAATKLAEQLHCPVLTTTAGRGVVREDHPLVVGPGFPVYGLELVNELLESSDLILAVGCKFAHNGSGGFKLKVPEAKLVHVDAALEVLNANYPASLAVCADAPPLLARLADELSQAGVVSMWTQEEIADFRHRFWANARSIHPHYPQAVDCRPSEISHLFDALRQALPRDCTVVTDSGLHQYLTRCFFEVQTPRGLVTPSDFQSMGYGLPAAVGAKLARPDRPTVVITGDGGFAMTGMELLTMVREKAPLAVIVFNDSALALIRDQQSDMFGDSFGVGLENPDFEAFAISMGVEYFLAEGNPEEQFKRAIGSPAGAIVEVRLNQSVSRRTHLAVNRLRRKARRSIGSWFPFKS